MSKRKKTKLSYDTAKGGIVRNLLETFMYENQFPVEYGVRRDIPKDSGSFNKLEEAASNEKVVSNITFRILKPIIPVLEYVQNENNKNKKNSKKNKKNIEKLDKRIMKLEKNQESLCHAIAFLAATMEVSSTKSSAKELEQDFSKLHKKFRKRKEDERKDKCNLIEGR